MSTTILIVDNGSVKVAATLQLQKIAEKLSHQTRHHIHPVSLQHADIVLTSFLREKLQQGKRDFIILPLFFGNSRALTKFIPDVQTELEKEFGSFDIKVTDPLYAPATSGVNTPLAEIIFEHIQQTSINTSIPLHNIVLVDHGSPSPKITEVRNSVADQVQTMLGSGSQLEQAVMERREGKQYDFNGDLLEDWLVAKAKQGTQNKESSAIVALLFSLPGRHAGAGGDIETICASVMQRYPNFKIGISPLVGEHPLLLEILADRLNG